jgi:hypothetical protein
MDIDIGRGVTGVLSKPPRTESLSVLSLPRIVMRMIEICRMCMEVWLDCFGQGSDECFRVGTESAFCVYIRKRMKMQFDLLQAGTVVPTLEMSARYPQGRERAVRLLLLPVWGTMSSGRRASSGTRWRAARMLEALSATIPTGRRPAAASSAIVAFTASSITDAGMCS